MNNWIIGVIVYSNNSKFEIKKLHSRISMEVILSETNFVNIGLDGGGAIPCIKAFIGLYFKTDPSILFQIPC